MSGALTATSPRIARLVGVAMAATMLLSVLVGGITAIPAHADGAIASTSFWLAQPDGAVLPVGNAPSLGSTPPLNQPIVGTAPTPDDGGYWLVASDGGVFTFGDAGFYGSEGGHPLNQPIVGMASTPDGNGYWLVASDGGVFTFGDAGFYGSEGGEHLNQPVVGIAPTPDGKGYWLIASDGGVFTFGDAGFFGSMGGSPLNKPMVGLTATPDGGGYWMFAGDGGVFTFGDAGFYGSTGNISTEPAQRVVSTSSGQGYWVVDQNGTSYGFGDAGNGPPPTQALLLKPTTSGDQAVLFALQQLGKPYLLGGDGPNAYDCSGLTYTSWATAGVGIPRVANDQYQSAGAPVALTDLQAGDLVFWGTATTDPTSVYHVAIYIGADQTIDAPNPSTPVEVSTVDRPFWNYLMPNGVRP
jgi:cell wall-associated NlpC family hydrolase